MTRDAEDFALLLEGANKIEVDLARNLLEGAGIPSAAEGPDFDVAELGRAVHDMVRGQNVYVPKALLKRAQDVLAAAWGERSVDGGTQQGR